MKTTRIVTAVAVMLGLAPGVADAQGAIGWRDSVQSLGLDTTPGRVHKLNCPPSGELGGSVWGDGAYTHDSAICVAAVHAGLFTAETGGAAVVEMSAGQESYEAATRNGVATRSYGAWTSTIVFPDAPPRRPPLLEVRRVTWSDSVLTLGWEAAAGVVHLAACPSGGVLRAPIWGDEHYTHDSGICAAAVHAGVIDPNDGGVVRITLTDGGENFEATVRNGVGSEPRGFWSVGMRLEASTAPPPPLGPIFENAREITWRDSVQSLGLRGRDGESFVMSCPPGGTTDTRIWGDGVYTDDSAICVAAVHAGAITAESGGGFTVIVRPGRSGYLAAPRNGVESSPYGAWTGSFEIIAG